MQLSSTPSRLPARANPPIDLLLSALQDNRWTGMLPFDTLCDLASCSRRKRFRDGERVVSRNQRPEGLAMVLKGGILNSNVSEDGRETVYSYVTEGKLWGLVAAIDGGVAPYDGWARGDTELAMFPSAYVHTLLDQNPELYRLIAQALSYRLRKAFAAVDDLALANLRQRIARHLCTLAMSIGRDGQDGAPISIRLKQEDIAAMAGGTRSSINRELVHFENEGALKRNYGCIEITDLNALLAACVTKTIFELS